MSTSSRTTTCNRINRIKHGLYYTADSNTHCAKLAMAEDPLSMS